MESGITREYEERIFLNRLGLHVVGIWPRGKDSSALLRRVHLVFIYFLMFFVMVPQWLDMYCLWGDISAYTETLMSNVYIIATVFKLSNFLISAQVFEVVLKVMRTNWINTMKTRVVEDKKIMYDASARARNYSTKYGYMTFFTAIMYMVVPIFNAGKSTRDREYPFFGRYYVDRHSDLIYGLCYLGQIVTGLIVSVANYATDSIFLVCVYHFCGQLRILKNDLEGLGRGGDSLSAKDKLTALIRRHQMEIRNARALQAIFSGSSLQQLLVSCLLLCANGFKLIVSLSNRDIEQLMAYVACMPMILYQILFYCQPGNELVVVSQLLNEAIYQSSWINLEPTLARHLIFMIQRTQKPLAITAGKIYVLSLQNFMRIVKMSMSALSVLQAMYRKNSQKSL
ncbi:odorant receptor Or2-like [Copidosoma floridanum]|uniref:odorant receptor Or2-like n=1 Tax=Copidosoma floridanum TaxID=29053 RepID=UPI0006C9DC5B|nr:odorant receptor Or2-like [Copidosoma floridanum]